MAKTLVTSARVDARDIAALQQYFESKGIVATSISEIISLAVEVASGAAHSFSLDSTEAALTFLRMKGLLKKETERCKKNIIRQLQAESVQDLTHNPLVSETIHLQARKILEERLGKK